MKNRNLLSNDWQEIFINRVRSVGVWCDVNESDHYRHFFISKNPASTVSISLCGQIVAPFEKLHENQVKQRCLICELYNTSGEEVKQKIYSQLEPKDEPKPKTQNPIQEKLL